MRSLFQLSRVSLPLGMLLLSMSWVSVAPATAANFFWGSFPVNTDWDNFVNWGPVVGQFPDDNLDAALIDVTAPLYPVLVADRTIGELMILNGTVANGNGTSNFRLTVNNSGGLSGATTVDGATSVLTVYPAGTGLGFSTGNLTIDDSASLLIQDGAGVRVNNMMRLISSNVEGNGVLSMNGPANAINDGVFKAVGGTLSIARSTTSTAQLDLDGAGNGSYLVEPNSQLVIDIPLLDANFQGIMRIKDGGEIQINHPWTLAGGPPAGQLEFQAIGTAILSGSPLTIDGIVDVSSGMGRILPATTFNSNADVRIDAGTTLSVEGGVVLAGGQYTGDGLFELGPTALVTAPTVIGQAGTHTLTVGLDEADWTIQNGASLTLNVASIDSAGGGFGGQMTIQNSASLVVDLPGNGPWSFDGGTILYQGDSNPDTFLGGDKLDMEAAAAIDVFGSGRIAARLDMAGTINIHDVGELLEIEGGSIANPNLIRGGTINGPGELVIQKSLHGFGTIAADISGAAVEEVRADQGQLSIQGSVTGIGILGTNDVDGVLNIVDTFHTSSLGTALELRGGEVTGGLIRNDGGMIRGNGSIKSSSVNNFGTIAANGGTLVIDTTNSSDLDGVAPSDGQGVLDVTAGNLEVRSNTGTVFNGQLRLAGGKVFSMSQANSLFRNAPASEDDDGSGDAGSVQFQGDGSIQLDTFEHASSLQVLAGIATIDATTIVFENSSNTSINATAELHLRGNTTIDPSATLVGAGTLMNTDGSLLTTKNGVVINTPLLRNEGTLQIGSSPGVLDVVDYEQPSTGEIQIELGGLTPIAQFDLLRLVGGIANLSGELEISLLGGFVPSAGDSFAVIFAPGGSVAGAFSFIDRPVLPAGHLQVNYQANRVVLTVAPGLAGDFNGSSTLDCLDVDALVTEIVAGTNMPAFDLNGDAAVDNLDLTQWLADAGAVNLASGNPYLPGDATLDGVVDGQDFIEWNSHKFTNTAKWCSGDFNADGVVDGSDFITWNGNKFTSADSLAAVPEPGLVPLLLCFAVWAFRRTAK